MRSETRSRSLPGNFLDTNQLANLYGVHPQTIYNWVSQNKLPRPAKIGNKNLWKMEELINLDVEEQREKIDQLTTLVETNKKPVPDVHRMLTLKDLKKLFRVSGKTIQRYYKGGIIPKPVRIGNRNLWKYNDIVDVYNTVKPYTRKK